MNAVLSWKNDKYALLDGHAGVWVGCNKSFNKIEKAFLRSLISFLPRGSMIVGVVWWSSLRAFAEDSGFSVSSIKEAIQSLKDRGYLMVVCRYDNKNGRQLANGYSLTSKILDEYLSIVKSKFKTKDNVSKGNFNHQKASDRHQGEGAGAGSLNKFSEENIKMNSSSPGEEGEKKDDFVFADKNTCHGKASSSSEKKASSDFNDDTCSSTTSDNRFSEGLKLANYVAKHLLCATSESTKKEFAKTYSKISGITPEYVRNSIDLLCNHPLLNQTTWSILRIFHLPRAKIEAKKWDESLRVAVSQATSSGSSVQEAISDLASAQAKLGGYDKEKFISYANKRFNVKEPEFGVSAN